ncbi:hypothetical protein [Methylobacterium platani]|uniref:Uncharacterized protein n=2 Tax=Methylobacterium platani TaxID=427683 RepID=A0A179S174_9HYPH|nr:hypothetical protein [Methylobacterium platani]KMO13103.1 hypothetical protein SQ03_22595 [Methylobacterium platani JCM 14648]OAS18560.1 hypothetical protein A5481_26165 [Methylobacterium platani]
MSPSGREPAPPSLLRRTWRMALIAVATSLAATHYLASRQSRGPVQETVASLRGLVEPETTGSITGSAARTRLDPCAAAPRP